MAERGPTQLDAYALCHVYASNELAVPEMDFALELTIGTRIRQELGALVVRVETGLQAGQRSQSNEVFAAQIDGEVMLGVASATQLGLAPCTQPGMIPTAPATRDGISFIPQRTNFLG